MLVLSQRRESIHLGSNLMVARIRILLGQHGMLYKRAQRSGVPSHFVIQSAMSAILA
jgi:hypothetical protein